MLVKPRLGQMPQSHNSVTNLLHSAILASHPTPSVTAKNRLASSIKTFDTVVRQRRANDINQMRGKFCDLIRYGFLERIRR